MYQIQYINTHHFCFQNCTTQGVNSPRSSQQTFDYRYANMPNSFIRCIIYKPKIRSLHNMRSLGGCHMENPAELLVPLKSRKVSFVHNFILDCRIVLKFYTEHGCDTAVLCVKFYNDWTFYANVTDEQVITRFEWKKYVGWVSYIASPPPGFDFRSRRWCNSMYICQEKSYPNVRKSTVTDKVGFTITLRDNINCQAGCSAGPKTKY